MNAPCGIRKIILVNGHGGNTSFLTYFCQAQLARRRDYAVFLYQPARDPETDAAVQKMRKTDMEMHGGETETSTMLAHRPDLVDLERAGDQSGADQARLAGLENVYTGIWWYARFPNHYAGDARPANRELGEFLLERNAKRLAATIKAVKEDTRTLDLQQRYFTETEQPLKTPQRQ
jgi:creatinine amidohydrolase